MKSKTPSYTENSIFLSFLDIFIVLYFFLLIADFILWTKSTVIELIKSNLIAYFNVLRKCFSKTLPLSK